MRMNYYVRKILGAMVAPIAGICFETYPAYSNDCEIINVQSAEDIKYYAANMSEFACVEFYIGKDIECSPKFSQGDLVFRSASPTTPSSLKLEGSCFAEPESLELFQFKRLEIVNRDEQGSAISGAEGAVRIHSVTDNKEDTPDVILSSISNDYLICSQEAVYLSNNGCISASGNIFTRGGLIFSDYISLSCNEDIYFYCSSGSSLKAASIDENSQLYVNGTVEVYGNGNISFRDNMSSSIPDDTQSAHGAAIHAASVNFTENGNIQFSGNFSSAADENSTRNCGAYGGAISSAHGVSMTGNGNIDFSQNRAMSSTHEVTYSPSRRAESFGGAIFGNVSMIDNGDISFCNNIASAGSDEESSYIYALGGALVGGVELIGNGDITFDSNSVSVHPTDYDYVSYARGGAIANYGESLSITGNGNVSFRQNRAENTISRYGAEGGAIYGSYRGGLFICNNENVLFERNAEIAMGNYRLRSIYMDAPNSERAISLSAAEGKSIEFRDAIYIGQGNIVKLNACYVDSSGQEYEQNGDVIFTGATTEADLLAVKGSAGTAEEILNSRTTEVLALTNLYGGRLRVEDGAVYMGYGITAHEGSAATVLVKDAKLNHVGYNLTFNAGTTLAAEGVSSVSGNVVMLEGSNLALTVGAANSSAAVLTLASAMDLQGVHLAVSGAEYLLAGKYQLIHDSAYHAADWASDVLSISGCEAGALAWENGVLTLTCTNTWNQAAEDGATIGATTGNLVVSNGAAVTLNGALSADAAQQGLGHLIIDSGVARLEQGASVAGDVVFAGTQQAKRTLVAEADTSLNSVVLATARSESSSIEVSDGQEVALATVEGTGNLSKEGGGTLTHTGESTGVQGKLVVNEGKLVNTGTLAFDKIELNGGQLENQGAITGVEINGGILSGSGVFGGLTMKGGRLVVGNSPGFQQYTDDLHAEGGELVFSAGGVAEAATSTCKGWDSTVYSNIDMGGNELHLGADTTLTIALGGSMLENLRGDFSMVLFSNVGNIDFFTDGVLATLLENTRFIATDEEVGLREGWEAGADLSALVHDVAYSVSGSSLVLSGQFGAVPEPTTATLSLLALAGLAARRRRR